MILLLGDRDRVWLRVAAEAIRRAARSNGVTVPLLAAELESLACPRPSATSLARVADFVEGDAMTQLAYRFDEAASLLGVSKRTVERLVASGDLPAITVLSDRRITREDLLEYVESRRSHPVGAA